MERPADPLICPVCPAPLSGAGRSLRCPQGHTFDVAREGYVDLLPAGHGRSRIRGDTAVMVRARRRFLERGHYERLAARIEERAGLHLAGRNLAARPGAPGSAGGATVLEVGCGEGYHIGRLARSLPRTPGAVRFFGLDISKDALRLAARAHRDVRFFINDVRHRICLADASVDVLLDAFAPRNSAEFARVVRPGGLLIVVIPDEDHLAELRAEFPLLGIEPDKRERVVARLGESFRPDGEEAIEYRSEMRGDDVADLLRMTPNYWHLGEPELARAAALPPRSVTIAVTVLGFMRDGGSPAAIR